MKWRHFKHNLRKSDPTSNAFYSMKEASEQKFDIDTKVANRLNFQNDPGFIGLSLLLFEIYAPKVFEISEMVILATFERMQNEGTQNRPPEASLGLWS